MLETKQLTVALTSILFFFYSMEANGYRQLFGYPHSSKNLVLNRRKRLMRV